MVAASRPDEVNVFFFFLDLPILPAVLGPGVTHPLNKNEYQKQKNNVAADQSAAGA
jgi:hypothetical protein